MCIPWVLSEDSWLKRSQCSHEAACLAPSSTSQRVDWKGKKEKYSSIWRYLVSKGRPKRCQRSCLHALAFSPSSKPQTGVFSHLLSSHNVKARPPPNAKPNISPYLFSILLPLHQYSVRSPPTPSWPDSALSSNEWYGSLTPLITTVSNGLT